jgi:membrane protease YdiL (CAAX protease family)
LNTPHPKFNRIFPLAVALLTVAAVYGIRQGSGILTSDTLLQIIAAIGSAGAAIYYGLDYARPTLGFADLLAELTGKAKQLGYGMSVFAATHLAILLLWWAWMGLTIFPHNFSFALLRYAVVIALAVAIWEELIYRGPCLWLINRFRLNRPFALVCIVFQAGMFAWLHTTGRWQALSSYGVAVFCAGLLFGLLSAWTKSLWPAMGAHAGWNFIGYLSHGITHPPLQVFQGMASTAETAYSAYSTAALAGLTLVIFIKWWRSAADKGRPLRP